MLVDEIKFIFVSGINGHVAIFGNVFTVQSLFIKFILCATVINSH